MPEEEPILVLEKQVHRLLDVVKQLKLDNSHLQAQVKQIGRQLAKKKTDEARWQNDRSKVEVRVRRLLAELDSLSHEKSPE
jgi:chromosome segregation ATPase